MLRRAVIALCLVQDPIHSPYAKKLMVKLRYFFFGLFVLLGATPYLLPGYVASHPSYMSLSSISLSVITIILLILVLYFISYVNVRFRPKADIAEFADFAGAAFRQSRSTDWLGLGPNVPIRGMNQSATVILRGFVY